MDAPVPTVVMYTLRGCRHCATARGLLKRLDLAFEERPVDGVTDFRGLLAERTGGRTVPQIVIRASRSAARAISPRLQRRGVLRARVNGDAFPVAVVRQRPAPGRLLAALLTHPASAGRAAWRQSIELRDAAGRVVERRATPSGDVDRMC